MGDCAWHVQGCTSCSMSLELSDVGIEEKKAKPKR